MSDQQARVLARFAENPGDASAFDDAVDVLIGASNWKQLVDFFAVRSNELPKRDHERHWRRGVESLEVILNRVSNAAERARLLCATAAIWEDELARPDQALLGYQAAFRLDRAHDRAIEHARRIQAAQGNWLMVARSYQQQLQVDRDDGDRARLLAEAATVQRTRLGDEAAATRMLAEARELDATIGEPEEAPQEETDWTERLEKLESQLYGTRGTERADLLYAISAILIDEPGDHEQAEPYVTEARRLHPHSSDGLRIVARFHLMRGEHEEYQGALEKIASGKGGADSRADALIELARFRLDDGDHEGGDRALARALELAPRTPSVLALAHDRYRVTGNWGALTTALERSIEERPRGAAAIETHVALGEIYWRDLDQLDEAERHFKRVRLSDGRNPQMLRFYVDLYGHRGQWDRVLANLRTLRGIAKDVGEKIELSAEMADIARDRLDDLDAAIDIWTAARSEHPESREAAEELRRGLREGEKWNRLVELLKADVAALPDDAVADKIELLTETARLYQQHFNLPVLVGNTYRQILELEPNHPEACRVLTDRYVKAGRWNDLVGLLEGRLAVTEDISNKATILHEIARVSLESLGDLRAAATTYEAVLELCADDAFAIDELKKIYGKLDPQALFDLRRRELRLLSDARRDAAIRELIVMAQQLDADTDARIELYEGLVELAPADEEAADRLEALYEKDLRWDTLIELRTRRVEQAETPDATRLRGLAELLAERAPDAAREESLWRAVVALEPEDADAAKRFASCLVAAQDWDELEVFAGQREDWSALIVPLEAAAKDADDAALWRRVARIKSERVDDRAGQIDALRRVWSLDSTDLRALRELEHAQGLIGDHEGRVETLRSLVERAEDAERKGHSLALASVLSDEVEAHGEAYDVLSAVYLDDPADADVLARVVDAATRAERLADLLVDLKRRAAGMPAGTPRQALYLAIVELGEGAAESPLDAIDYLERLRTESPDDPEIRSRLVDAYVEAEQWEPVVELLEEIIASGSDAQRDAAALRLVEVRVGHIGTHEHPMPALEELGITAPKPGQLRVLRERLAAAEAWAPAVEVADAEAQVATNAAAAREAALAAADALSHVDAASAASRLAQLIASAPKTEAADLAALRLLGLAVRLEAPERWAAAAEPALDAHERWSELVDALELQEVAESNVERLARLADLHEHRLDDRPAALQSLIRMGARARDADRARAVELARALEQLPKLVEAWRSHAASEVSIGFLSDLASLLDNDLGVPDEARHVWMRAYVLDPTSALAAEALERLNRSLDADEDLADHLISSAENAPDGEKAVRLREAAEILAAGGGRATEAVPLFERALELAPRELQSYEGLEGLYRRLGDDESLLDLLKRKIATFSDRPEVMAASLTNFGTTVFERGGGARVALHAYRKALAAQPNHPATIHALEQLHHESGGALPDEDRAEIARAVRAAHAASGEFEALVLFLERGVERAAEGGLVALHREAALLSTEELEDPQRAFHHWGQALLHGDRSADAAQEFASLGRTLASDADVIHRFEGVLEVYPDAVAVRTELVEIYLESGDRESAIRHLEIDALARPRELPTLLRLEALYRETGASADTAALLMRKARGLPKEQAAEALREASTIYRGSIGDPAQEADALLRLHRLEPDDGTAERLEDLLAGLGRWEELATLLATRAHGIDGPDGTDIRLRQAQLIESRLDDTPRAVAAYRAVLEHQADEPVALERLDVLFDELGMPAERASILELRIPLVDDALRVALTTELARLAAFELNEPDTGVGLLRNVLDEDPVFAPAIEALEQLAIAEPRVDEALEILVATYRTNGVFEEAVRVLSAAASSGPRGSRVRLLEQARDIYENDIRDVHGAYAIALEAVLASQGNTAVVADAVRLAQAVQEWRRLAGAVEDVVDLNPDPGGRTELLLLLGEIYEERLSSSDEAEQAYRLVLESHPHQLDALNALDRIYAASGHSGAHAAVVDALLESVDDEGRRLTLLRRSAALHECEDEDLETTLARYESILAADPDDAAALARMRTLIRRTEDWQRLEGHLGRMIEVESSDVGRAPLLLELASVRASELGRPDDAVEPLAELLTANLTNPQGRRLAESLLQDGQIEHDSRPVLLEALAEVYRENEEWHDLSDVLETLATLSPPEIAGPKWYELASVLENQLGEREAALDAYASLLRVNPSSGVAFDAMVRISIEERTWDKCLGIATAVALQETTAEEDRTRLLVEVARLAAEWPGDEARALLALEALAAASPMDPDVRWELERIYHRKRDWESLTRLYTDAAIDSDDAVGAEFLRKAASVQLDLAGDPDRAVDLLETARSLDDPQAGTTARRLASVLRETGQWDTLASLLREVADATDDPDVADEASWELAYTRLQHLQDQRGAVDRLRPLLDSPSRGRAAFELASQLLRSLVGREPEPLAVELADLLEERAREDGRWGVVTDALTVRSRSSDDPAASAAALTAVANVQRRLSRRRAEFTALAAALALDLDSLELKGRLRQLADEIGDIGIYRHALTDAAGVPRSESAARLMVEAAQVAEHDEKDPLLAMALLRAVVDVRPSDRETVLELERLSEITGAFDELSVALHRRLALAGTEEERIALLGRLVEVTSSDEDPTEYIALLAELAESDPSRDNVERLEEIARLNADAARLEQALAARAGWGERAATEELAVLRVTEFCDYEGAIAVWREHIATSGDDLGASRALAELYRETSRLAELADALDRVARATDQADERHESWAEGAGIRLRALQQPDEALKLFADLSAAVPNSEEAKAGLVELLDTPETAAGAARALEPLAAADGDAERRLELLDVMLQHSTKPESQVDLCQRMSTIAEEDLDDIGRAFEFAMLALEFQPTNPVALHRVRGAATRADRVGELAAALDERAAGCRPPEAALLLRLAGDLYRGPLNDAAAGMAAYKRAVEIHPDSDDAASSFDAVADEIGAFQIRADVMEARLDALTGSRALTVALELAALCEKELGDGVRAARVVRRALSQTPGNEDAVAALERLATLPDAEPETRAAVLEALSLAGEPIRLASFVADAVEHTDGVERGQLLVHRALALESEDAAAASADFVAALEADPNNREAFAGACRTASEPDVVLGLVQAARASLVELRTDADRHERLAQVASVARDVLRDSDETESLLKQAITLDPDGVESVDELVALYVEQRRKSDALALLAEMAAQTSEAFVRARHHRRRVELADGDDGQVLVDAVRAGVIDSDTLEALAARTHEDISWQAAVEALDVASQLVGVAEQEPLLLTAADISASPDRAPTTAAERLIEYFHDAGTVESATRAVELLGIAGERVRLRDAARALSARVPSESGVAMLLSAAEADETADEKGEAAVSYRLLLAIDPTHELARTRFEELSLQLGDAEAVIEVLRGDLARDIAGAAEIHARIARLAHEQLGQVELAEEHLSAALAVSPDDLGPLTALLDFYESVERCNDADALIRSRLHMASDDARRAELLRLQARVLQDRGDADASLAALEEAFDLSPTDDLVDALAAQYESIEDWTSLQSCLFRAASEAAPELAVPRWIRLADLAETRLEDPDLARTAFEEALASGAIDDTILSRVLAFYEESGLTDETDEVLVRALDASQGRSSREQTAMIQYLRGRVAELRGSDADALHAYEASYTLSTSYLPNLMRLGERYLRDGRFADAVKPFRSALLHQHALPTDADRVALFLRLGELRYREGDDKRARDMFQRVLALSPKDEDAARSIRAIDEGDELYPDE